jgi:hypothetical protein
MLKSSYLSQETTKAAIYGIIAKCLKKDYLAEIELLNELIADTNSPRYRGSRRSKKEHVERIEQAKLEFKKQYERDRQTYIPDFYSLLVSLDIG